MITQTSRSATAALMVIDKKDAAKARTPESARL